jgi:hypothetical protein
MGRFSGRSGITGGGYPTIRYELFRPQNIASRPASAFFVGNVEFSELQLGITWRLRAS